MVNWAIPSFGAKFKFGHFWPFFGFRRSNWIQVAVGGFNSGDFESDAHFSSKAI